MEPKIHIQPGTLPPFWNRRVIFFANLLSLFYGNEGETQQLVDEIGGLPSYGGRLIPILNILFQREDNLLVLEEAPQPDLMAYFADTALLSMPDWVVLASEDYPLLKRGAAQDVPSAVKEIQHHEAEWMDGFVTDRSLADLADALGKKTVSTHEGSIQGNNKYLLHRFLEEKRLPTFDTEEAASPDDISGCLTRLKAAGYRRAAIKAPIGASGIGMMKVSTDFGGGEERVPDHLFHEGAVLVQGWVGSDGRDIDEIYSPSVQLFIGDDELYAYDITEQVLTSDSIHEGNLSPPPYFDVAPDVRDEMLAQAEIVSRWLHDQGYRGTASIDYLVAKQQEEWDVYVCEVNARVTGATYPSVLARRFLPHGAWLMRNVRFIDGFSGRELLEILGRQDELVTPEDPTGILPINFNLQPDRDVQKGQFLFIGENAEACQDALERLELLMPVAWQFDRD